MDDRCFAGWRVVTGVEGVFLTSRVASSPYGVVERNTGNHVMNTPAFRVASCGLLALNSNNQWSLALETPVFWRRLIFRGIINRSNMLFR